MCMHKLEHIHTVYIDMCIHIHHMGPVVPQVVLTKKIRNSEAKSMPRMALPEDGILVGYSHSYLGNLEKHEKTWDIPFKMLRLWFATSTHGKAQQRMGEGQGGLHYP